MVIELSEFWSRLVRAGVLDAPQCQVLADQYRKSHDGNPASQADQLARFLVQKNVLTPFQSEAFLAQPPVELRLGPYLIRDPKAESPLGRFAEAKQTTDGAIGVLLRTGPGNPWLTKHTTITATNLQSFVTEIIGDYEAVFSPVGKGKVLSQKLSDQATDQPWTTLSVVSLGTKIAAAMSVMHDADMVHGAVRADRIWIRDDGEVILLRDPSGPPQQELLTGNPDSDESTANGGWLETVDDPSLYISPELAPSDANPDPSPLSSSSDIYSLGCLLFRLASGRYPIQGASSERTLALHATDIPKELTDAIEQGEKGDPLYRVLAYTMAKSPEARFASGKQLAAALVAVGQSLPSPSKQRQSSLHSPTGRVEPKRGEGNLAQPSPAATSPDPPAAPDPPAERAGEVPDVAARKSATVLPDGRVELTRVRRKRKNRAPWVLVGLAGIVVLQTIALTFMDPSQPVVRRRRAEFVPPAVVPRVSNRPVRENSVLDATVSKQDPDSGENSYQVVQDQRLLYIPPVDTRSSDSQSPSTNPITLDLLPPGPAMIVSVRLSDVRRSAVGQSMLDAFSPELPALLDSMVTRLGVPAEKVSRVTVAFYPGNSSDNISVAFSVTLLQPQPMQDLLKAWDVSAARTREGQTIYVGDEPNSDAFYLPAEQAKAKQVIRFGVGAIDPISELASIDGEPIPLPRSLRSLWNATNQNADVCVLVTSNYLFADGRSFLQGSIPQAVEPLRRLLIPHTSAVLLMTESPSQSDDAQQLYSEVRFSASGGITEASLAQLVSKTIEQWPSWANDFATTANADDSWKPLADRLPSMIGFVADRIRVGVDERTAVANLYVPSMAIPQLSLGTVLAMNTPMGQLGGSDQPSGEILTLDQILARPMSVSFGQESLEFAIDAIIDSLRQQLPSGNQVPTIRIIGGDLQLMGITQNQQIRDFAKKDLPLRQVLTELVVAANPDKSSTGPADLKQSLIWVVVGEESNRQILVTTRQAAATKEYELPTEFQP